MSQADPPPPPPKKKKRREKETQKPNFQIQNKQKILGQNALLKLLSCTKQNKIRPKKETAKTKVDC